ncbi:MAG TPA: glycosyltransferase family 87 protein [Candidatus Obscuribacterales bacterium]
MVKQEHRFGWTMPGISKKVVKIAVISVLSIGVLYVLGLIYLPALLGAPFSSRSGGKLSVMDFVTWYEAGMLARSPERTQIYEPDVQLRYLNELIAPERSEVPFFIAYPPYFFSLMAPLSLLPLRTAYILWIIAWPLVLMAALHFVLKKYAPRLDAADRAIFLLAVLFSQPLIISLRLGQTSSWLVTCICLFFHGLASKKDRLAGAALALSSIKPQYLLFLGLPAIAQRRWRLLASAVVAEMVLLVVAGLNVGWHNLIKYPSWLAYVETSPVTHLSISPKSMVSLRGLLSCLLPPEMTGIIMAALLIAQVIYLCRVWSAPRLKTDLRWPMALTLASATALSPHLHYHDLLILSVAAALTIPSLSIFQAARLPAWPLRYWCLLLLYYPFVSWLCFMAASSIEIPLLAIMNTALLLLAVSQVQMMLGNKEPLEGLS